MVILHQPFSVKITLPPIQFAAERGENGTVILKWHNNPKILLLLMFNKDDVQYRLGIVFQYFQVTVDSSLLQQVPKNDKSL